MKKLIVCVCMLLVVIIQGLSGCTQEGPSSDKTDVQSTPPTRESLETILEKAESLDSLYYEISMTMTISQYGTQTALMKIWQKKPYFKEQITSVTQGVTTTVSVIQRPEGVYVYDAAQGRYIMTTEIPPFVDSMKYFNSDMMKSLLANQSLTECESDIVNGKKATVVQYTLPLQSQTSMFIKVWIWNEKGLPLKAYIDMTMEEMSMTMEAVFSNYSFTEIPDSTFNVL